MLGYFVLFAFVLSLTLFSALFQVAIVMAPAEMSNLREDKASANFAEVPGEFDVFFVKTHDGLKYDVLVGKDFDGDRKTVMFYHGFLDTPYGWDGQLRYFQEQGYNVMAPTLRGY